MVTQLVRGVLLNLHTVQGPLRWFKAQGDKTANTALVLHTMLWTHDFMIEFSRCDTKNHPTISSEFVEYLAAHSNTKLVRKLQIDITNQRNVAQSAQSEAKAVKRKAEEALQLAKAKK